MAIFKLNHGRPPFAFHYEKTKGVDAEARRRKEYIAAAEIAHAVNPDLTITDARQIIGKSHHFSGGGIGFDADRVIISGDSLAAERVAAGILQECYPDFQVTTIDDTLNHAVALGAASLEDVVLKEASA